MENYLCESFKSYFNALSHLGYVKDITVEKLLVMSFIYEIINNDFKGALNEDDYNAFKKVLGTFYGTSCILPYREYMDNIASYTGSYSEFSHKMDNMQSVINTIENKLNTAENTKVVKVKERVNSIQDIQL